MAAFNIQQIGVIRSAGEDSAIEVFEPYRPALEKLDQFSHVMVFWWAHQFDNDAKRQITRVELPYAPGQTAGVFATRTEPRPNPIGLTTCSINRIDLASGVLHISWIDAFDGTPVLDLKPYLPFSDRVRDVHVAEWFAGWPGWLEDSADFFADHPIFEE